MNPLRTLFPCRALFRFLMTREWDEPLPEDLSAHLTHCQKCRRRWERSEHDRLWMSEVRRELTAGVLPGPEAQAVLIERCSRTVTASIEGISSAPSTLPSWGLPSRPRRQRLILGLSLCLAGAISVGVFHYRERISRERAPMDSFISVPYSPGDSAGDDDLDWSQTRDMQALRVQLQSPDPMLFRKVVLDIQGGTWGELAQSLSEQTQQSFEVAPGLRNQRLSFTVNPQPARDLLKSLKRRYHLDLFREETRGRYRYYIVPTSQALHRYEDASSSSPEPTPETRAFDDALRQIDSAVKYLHLSSDQRRQSLLYMDQQLQSAQSADERLFWRGARDQLNRIDTDYVYRDAMDVFNALTPEDVSRLEQGSTVKIGQANPLLGSVFEQWIQKYLQDFPKGYPGEAHPLIRVSIRFSWVYKPQGISKLNALWKTAVGDRKSQHRELDFTETTLAVVPPAGDPVF